MTEVLERLVAAPGVLREAEHRLLEQTRHGRIEGTRRLAGLEEDVGILGRSAQARVVRGEGSQLHRRDVLLIDKRAQVVLREGLDHVDLVRRPEAVEEVEERHAALEARDEGESGHVLSLLH